MIQRHPLGDDDDDVEGGLAPQQWLFPDFSVKELPDLLMKNLPNDNASDVASSLNSLFLLLASDTAVQEAMYLGGPMAVLSAMNKFASHESVQVEGCYCLQRFCLLGASIVEHLGGCQVIANALASFPDSNKIQFAACAALLALLDGISSQEVRLLDNFVHHQRGIQLVVHAMTSLVTEADMQLVCLGLLSKLASVPALREALKETDEVMNAVEAALDEHSDDEGIHHVATSLLKRLSGEDESEESVVEVLSTATLLPVVLDDEATIATATTTSAGPVNEARITVEEPAVEIEPAIGRKEDTIPPQKEDSGDESDDTNDDDSDDDDDDNEEEEEDSDVSDDEEEDSDSDDDNEVEEKLPSVTMTAATPQPPTRQPPPPRQEMPPVNPAAATMVEPEESEEESSESEEEDSDDESDSDDDDYSSSEEESDDD